MFQMTMMRAVEVRGRKDSEGSTLDVEEIAISHGFPQSLPAIVEEKFDESAHVFMKEHFKSAIPVRFQQAHIKIYLTQMTGVQSTAMVRLL